MLIICNTQAGYRWFSRYVIAAMLVDKNRFLITSFCSSTSIVHFTIVICVSRDWLQPTYS